MENVSVSKRVEECMNLLNSGKKVVWDRIYAGLPIPTVQVCDIYGESDSFDLECVGQTQFEAYVTEKPVRELETVSVVGYAGVFKKIEYVYANPQRNQIFAHLEDGTNVSYDLSLIDFSSAYGGEYNTDVGKPYEFTLVFFKNYKNGHHKYYTEESMLVPEEIDEVWKLSDYLRENCDMYMGMDIYVEFPKNFKNSYPLFIDGCIRKCSK